MTNSNVEPRTLEESFLFKTYIAHSTFHKTVTFRNPFVSTSPNTLQTSSCWEGPEQTFKNMLLCHDWSKFPIQYQFNLDPGGFKLIRKLRPSEPGFELASARASPPDWWTPSTAERPLGCRGGPESGGGPLGRAVCWCWVACSDLELIFCQGLQALQPDQSFIELSFLNHYLQETGPNVTCIALIYYSVLVTFVAKEFNCGKTTCVECLRRTSHLWSVLYLYTVLVLEQYVDINLPRIHCLSWAWWGIWDAC